MLAAAAGLYIFHIQGTGAYVFRNLLPILFLLLLVAITLTKGDGQWTGSGWSWPLGTLGFALPSIGLSVYIHHGFAVYLHGMFSESVYPLEVFRFLPYYTVFSGGIGFAIGWIAGRNV